MKSKLLLTILGGSLLTSCLEDTVPTTYITQEQMSQSESSLQGQNVAMAASVMNYGSSYSHAAYPALMMWRDVLCAELPIYATTYDYFGNTTNYMGEGQLYYDWWYQYFNTIHNANVLISLIDADQAQADTKVYLGNALGYRAWCYLEASQMWEYRRTGVTVLDNAADQDQIWGLTLPIIDETTTMEQSRNNPRAPFWQMMSFIHNDLTRAAGYLQDFKRQQVNEMDAASVSALLARFWMLAGSRFDMLDRAVQNLGVASANDCFAQAALAAQQAIDLSGAPTSREQWMDPTKGFNTAIQSWIFGIEMVPDDNTGESWKNYVSFMSPEASFGVCNATYEAWRLCDQSLYNHISDSDWRKLTWVAPADAGKAMSKGKYSTNLSDEEFASLPELCGLKYHCADGSNTDYKSAAAIDLPIIRVEEMYYILAEALSHTQGLSAGIKALESFTNAYRYTDGSYQCDAADQDSFERELIQQKRIEFWGEGIVYWDYKRLCRGVTRKYDASNHPSTYQYNSPDGVAARWWNFYIPSNEYQYNKAIVKNPDPSHTSEMEY